MIIKTLRSWLPSPLWQLLLGGLLWRGTIAWQLPPGFDEAYYYLYSRHLNWSYFDHPPLVALTTGLGWWLTGLITPFTIRVGALLLYTVSVTLLYHLGRRWFSAQTGLMAAAIATLTPLFWIAGGVLTLPDNALLLFWTLTLFLAAAEFLPPRSPDTGADTGAPPAYRPSYRIALIGLTVGLACLSKYHGFVLGLSLIGFCLTQARYRRALWSPWLGIALAIFLLTLLPLWVWNSQHDWISFRFQLSLRFDGADAVSHPYQLMGLLSTWLLGVAYLFPTVGLPLWGITARSLGRYMRGMGMALTLTQPAYGRDRDALILWVSLPIAVGFTLLGGKQPIYPAWPLPGFWGLTLLLAHSVTQWRSRQQQRWLVGTGLAVATLCLVALLHITLGILQKPGHYSVLGGLVPASADGSTALLDIHQLRQRIADLPDRRDRLRQASFIFTDEFYLSAYLDMAVQPLTSTPITCFSQDPRGFAFWHQSEQWVGQNGLYVTLASLHSEESQATQEYENSFQALEKVDQIPLTRGGVVTETVWIYQAHRLIKTYQYPYPARSR